MSSWLILITSLVNLAALIVSLWLALYIVTRSRHTLISWLAALTVLSVATWFLHNMLLSGLPDEEQLNLRWLDSLGQVVKLSPLFWFCLSYRFRADAGELHPWERTLNMVVIGLGCVVVIYQIIESEFFSYPSTISTALHFADRWISRSYPFFLGLLIVLPLLSLVNLFIARRQTRSPMLRRHLDNLLGATGVAYLAGLYTGWATYLQLDVPAYPADALLGVSIGVLGYTVAKYNSLIEGRPLARDALLSLIGVGAVVLIYSLLAWFLYAQGLISFLTYVFVLVCAIIVHTLYDGGRVLLDRLVLRARFRRFRAELRQLAEEAGTGLALPDQLLKILEALRRERGIRHGWIAVRQGEHFVVQAATDPAALGQRHALATLTAPTVVPLDGSGELAAMALLVPLAVAGEQVGALALGPKESAGSPLGPYGSADLVALETLAPQLAAVIQLARQQETETAHLEQAIDNYRQRARDLELQVQRLLAAQASPADSVLGSLSEREQTALVEQALRHLHQYAFLGEHPLAQLPMVRRILAETVASDELGAMAYGPLPMAYRPLPITHVDRGKALHTLLVQTLKKLRPAGPEPDAAAAPRRAWHDYLILYESYVCETPTNDIMSRLYIGEGTYNRTRRTALRSVAKILHDLERDTVTA